jgi:hypothetical protein
MLIEIKIQEGLDPAEARRAALIELGGEEQVNERVREARVGYQLDTLLQDRHSDRTRGARLGRTAIDTGAGIETCGHRFRRRADRRAGSRPSAVELVVRCDSH